MVRRERLGWKRSPGRPGWETRMTCSKGEVREMGGKIFLKQTSPCKRGQFMAAGRASPLPTAAPSPLTWGSLVCPCTRLRSMCKCIPILVWCINASLYFEKFVCAQLAGLARQMDKEPGNKKERGNTDLHCPWTSTCAQPSTMSLQSYPNWLTRISLSTVTLVLSTAAPGEHLWGWADSVCPGVPSSWLHETAIRRSLQERGNLFT